MQKGYLAIRIYVGREKKFGPWEELSLSAQRLRLTGMFFLRIDNNNVTKSGSELENFIECIDAKIKSPRRLGTQNTLLLYHSSNLNDV